MKKLIFILLISLSAAQMYSQASLLVNWTDPTYFKIVHSPDFEGYGPLSDSLSKTFPGKEFYFHNGKYYPVSCLADYYLWYVNRYYYSFSGPVAFYESSYLADDVPGMIEFVFGLRFMQKIEDLFIPPVVDTAKRSDYVAYNDDRIVTIDKITKLRELKDEDVDLNSTKKDKKIKEFVDPDTKQDKNPGNFERKKYLSDRELQEKINTDSKSNTGFSSDRKNRPENHFQRDLNDDTKNNWRKERDGNEIKEKNSGKDPASFTTNEKQFKERKENDNFRNEKQQENKPSEIHFQNSESPVRNNHFQNNESPKFNQPRTSDPVPVNNGAPEKHLREIK